MSRFAIVTLSALALIGCATAGTARLTTAEKRGQTFAQAHCAQCHGVMPGTTSPNPESPAFEAIGNQPELTRETLATFLRDSHNFPAAMNFSVSAADVDDLTAYLLTLRKPGYKPAI
ncbi:MAG: c-type cytochrome [Novosphingobium sp.]